MATLKAVAEALLLPPMCFLLVAVLGLLFARHYHRFAVTVARIGVAGLVAFAIPAVPWTLIFGLEYNMPLTPAPGAPPTAIVVLGGDVNRIANAPFAQPGWLT